MAHPKFADAVLSRYNGKGTPSASAEPPDDDEPAEDAGAKTDAENGRMLATAIKRGDGAAICEAVRRISGA